MHKRLCDLCEGTGRLTPDPYNEQTWKCPDGCEDGYFPMTRKDFDGLRGKYKFMVGYFFVWHDSLCLQDEAGVAVLNLDPDKVEILNG